jgi:ferredoxin
MPTVKFIREKLTIEVAYGANLREAALAAGIELYSGVHAYLNCRGKGLCHTCTVRPKNDTGDQCSPRGAWERIQEFASWYAVGNPDVRLSCQLQVLGDLEIETQPEFNWSGEFK